MKYRNLIAAMLVAACSVPVTAVAQGTTRQLQLEANRPGAVIQPTMYGIFFEDINFGADGGLYAEMVENRSFEFPQHLMGWTTYGNVSLGDLKPAFPRNPHYAVMERSGHKEKITALENHGFFGMGYKAGLDYDFSAYVRLHHLQGKASKLRIVLADDNNVIIAQQDVTVGSNQWQKVTARLRSAKTASKGLLRVLLASDEAVDIDHISLFPSDNWHGLRADLVKALEDLHPGIFRFPGGCIVEGTDLATRYQWKNTVGPVENRPLNENRWIYSKTRFPSRPFANYYQSYGLGFYEFFLLSEKIGAEPLPILNCGLACQYQNNDADSSAHVAIADLQPYIDDALDLIEFANGPTTTKWGRLRAGMGHPEPFHLKQIGVGNEQWGPLYSERLQEFVKQIRQRHPEIKICGSAGPSASGDKFDYGWKEMRRIGVDLVDEHYYMPLKWFRENAVRYNSYPRRGPKVFAGEYAAHSEGQRNNWEAALSEAAFMTGLERNADVVWQATYAPLFAHVNGWQWRPNLIWFDNLHCLRTLNWYVQMLNGTNLGSNVIPLTESGKAIEGRDGLYATASYIKASKGCILKLVNTSAAPQTLRISLKGTAKDASFRLTTLTGALDAENTFEHPETIVPKASTAQVQQGVLTLTLPAYSFVVARTE